MEQLHENMIIDHILLKVIIIGDSGVGKSNIMLRYTKDTFDDTKEPTIGADFFLKVVKLDERRAVKLQIWDTAGQEKYRGMTIAYYKGAHGVMIVYDISDRTSFENVQR